MSAQTVAIEMPLTATKQKSMFFSKLSANLSCWTMTRTDMFKLGVENAKAHKA